MFGYVSANWKELTKEQQDRYGSVYCGICRRIREQSGQIARLGLSYDMAFLGLLLMSLYEPEEESGKNHCLIHPVKRRPWVDNEIIRYCADMNVALAYYNFLDDYTDEGKASAKFLAHRFGKNLDSITARWPRQCESIRDCIARLSALEKAGCDNPDEPAQCFGELMGELLVYREDLWASTLRQMGQALGRFIYLTDAAVDYRRDEKKHKYNPFLAMGRCTAYFEKLPLVQDKALLDNILYSGVWTEFRRMEKQAGGKK